MWVGHGWATCKLPVARPWHKIHCTRDKNGTTLRSKGTDNPRAPQNPVEDEAKRPQLDPRLFYKQGQRIKTRTQPSKQRQISKIERILLRIWSHFQQDSSRAIATKEPVAWPHSFEEAKTSLGKSLEFSNMASVCAGYDEMTHLKRKALTPAGKPLGRKHLIHFCTDCHPYMFSYVLH